MKTMNLALFDFDGTVTTTDTFTPFVKDDNEIRLGRFIMQQLNTGRLPSLFDCQERFGRQTRDIPQLQVGQHSLKQYGLLLQGGRHD